MRAKANPLHTADVLLIGIGAQKAGTSWLAKMLARHPDVHMPRKEVHYWDRVRAPFQNWAEVPRALGRGGALARLLAPLRSGSVRRAAALVSADPHDHSGYGRVLTRGYLGQRCIAELTPAYALCGVRTFREMMTLHPDTRIVFVMRDPVERLWSGVRARHGAQISRTPDHAFLLECFADALGDPHHPDHRRSDYATTLERLATLPEGRVHFMFYETLFEQAAMDGLTAFLGIAPVAVQPQMRVNGGRAVGVCPDAALVARAVEAFAPTYQRVRALFGAAVPSTWHAPAL